MKIVPSLHQKLATQPKKSKEASARTLRSGLTFVLSLLVASAVESTPPKTPTSSPHTVPAPATGTVLLSPIEITREGLDFVGQEGLLLVPENRAKPSSRKIAVHFFHFPAKEATGKAPFFYLPGGPGGSYSERHFYEYYGGERAKAWTTELKALNQNRDLVIVNQRGNPRAPGMNPKLRWKGAASALDKAPTEDETRAQIRDALKLNLDRWQKLGVDLAGYDILNITDDLEDLRKAFGYDMIALRGTSFGSQWSLAYMQRYPNRVDRALLSGIEPLDHAYDSPQGLWNALQRLEERALRDPELATALSAPLEKQGLLGAYRRAIENLEEKPQVVEVPNPESGDKIQVTLGATDLRDFITGSHLGSRRESLQSWPSFVAEIARGDLSSLAPIVAEERLETNGPPMIGLLIDNSLGISAAREARLRLEPAYEWLGNINLFYTASRDLTPTPTLDDTFRQHRRTDIPVLMVQGDLDFSTPLENALELLPFLSNGHLLIVRDGTHSAFRELTQLKPEVMKQVLSFVDEDFESSDPKSYFSTLPTTVELPPLTFRTPEAGPLVEELKD